MSVKAATVSQQQKIAAKVNESVLYNISYPKLEVYWYFGTYIYRNGELNQSLLSSNGTFYGTNEFLLLVNISTYQEDEAGEYFIIAYTDSFKLLVNGCPPDSFYFVRYYLWIFGLIQYAATLQILTAGK